MRNFITLMSLLFLGCLSGTECDYDADCASWQECSGGLCLSEPTEPGPGPSGLPAGAVVTPCSCYTTSVPPGTITASSRCASGRKIRQLCNYQCCDGFGCYGYAWGSVCY